MDFQASRSMSFILLLSIFFLPRIPTVAADDQIVTACYGNSSYTSGSQYEANLRRVLSFLPGNATQRRDAFFNTSYGEDPDKVYGFSQCMSDASEDDCRKCLNVSQADLTPFCPNSMRKSIRYENCILRYSNRSFIGQPDSGLLVKFTYPENATNLNKFNEQLGALMDDISTAASSAESKYAVNVRNYSFIQKIFGMAQCTRDLSTENCYNCLRRVIDDIPKCCDGKSGGSVYTVSCNIKYETSPFFSMSPPPSPPPPTPVQSPPTNSSQSTGSSGKGKKTRTILIIVFSIIVPAILISALFTFFRSRKKQTTLRSKSETKGAEITENLVFESYAFKLDILITATNNFSIDNKLGEGGFGPVFKGKLVDGREIAVKKLSKSSNQGLEEMRNEVTLVAKLQHRNLVRLWGWCIEGQEMMLVYEYIANISLDKFLFDPAKRGSLNWERRLKIITGIARGLVYLHEDSRLRIVHRDLKASNILLDENMNPKIADFGLAKLFTVDQSQGNTSRIAGTYGYMAPEYIMDGKFSTQSDVFSFGVLVLEIITGRRNMPFIDNGRTTNLTSYAWKHWNGASLEPIIDRSIAKQLKENEVARCLHMALLCVQNDESRRPTMSAALLMLNSYSATFSAPSIPGFFVRESFTD